VKNNPEISSAEWLSLNQFLYEVKQIDAACVSVYYPYGKGQQTISLLQETKRKEPFEKIESEIEKKNHKTQRESLFCRQVYKNSMYFWMDKERQSTHQRNWNFKKTAFCVYGKQKTIHQTIS